MTNPQLEVLAAKLNSKILEFNEPLLRQLIGEMVFAVTDLLPELLNIVYSYLEKYFLFDLLKNEIEQGSDLKNILWQLVIDSKQNKDCSIAAANAITLLNILGISFNNMDLRNIKIPGANLSGAQLDNTNLQGADLKDVDFSSAWLRQCNLSHTNLKNVWFGELPNLALSSNCAAFSYSKDFNYLAVGGQYQISIYNGITREFLYRFEDSDTRFARCIAFGEDGKFVSSDGCNTVALWDAKQQLHLHTFRVNRLQEGLAFGANGLIAIVIADSNSYNIIQLWDSVSKQLIHAFDEHIHHAHCVAFGPNNKLAFGGDHGSIYMCDTQAKKVLYTLEVDKGNKTSSVDAIVFGQDGQLISADEADVRLWDINKRKFIGNLDNGCRINCMTYNRNGLIATSNMFILGGIRLWDVKYKKLLRIFDTGSQCIAFGPDNTMTYTICDNTLRFIEVTPRQYFYYPKRNNYGAGGCSFYFSVVFGSKGELAFGTFDCLQLWDIFKNKLIREFKGNAINSSISFIANGLLASNCYGINLWDIEQNKLIKILRGHKDAVSCIASGPDNIFASGGNDRTIRLWDIKSMELIHTFKDLDRPVMTLSFSNKGLLASTYNYGYTVQLWDPIGKKLLHTFERNHIYSSCATFGHDEILASGSCDGAVCLWDTKNYELIHTFSHNNKEVRCIAFGPQQILASGGADNFACLWNLVDKSCIAVIPGSSSGVSSLSWFTTSQNFFLATGCCRDRSVRVWKLTREKSDKLNVTLFFTKQRNTLNLHNVNIDDAGGLSNNNREIILQHNAENDLFKSNSVIASKNKSSMALTLSNSTSSVDVTSSSAHSTSSFDVASSSESTATSDPEQKSMQVIQHLRQVNMQTSIETNVEQDKIKTLPSSARCCNIL